MEWLLSGSVRKVARPLAGNPANGGFEIVEQLDSACSKGGGFLGDGWLLDVIETWQSPIDCLDQLEKILCQLLPAGFAHTGIAPRLSRIPEQGAAATGLAHRFGSNMGRSADEAGKAQFESAIKCNAKRLIPRSSEGASDLIGISGGP
jgi:hypothetical protein